VLLLALNAKSGVLDQRKAFITADVAVLCVTLEQVVRIQSLSPNVLLHPSFEWLQTSEFRSRALAVGSQCGSSFLLGVESPVCHHFCLRPSGPVCGHPLLCAFGCLLLAYSNRSTNVDFAAWPAGKSLSFSRCFNFSTDRVIKSSLDIVMVALLPRIESGTAVGMFDGKVVCGV